MSKIVLIGANHAGTACANTILDHYPENELVIFDQNDNISFLSCGMALWIGRQIKSPDGLFYSSKAILENKGAKVHLETPVESIDYDKKIVYALDKNGQKIAESYDKLVLATGSKPIIPPLKGLDLENIQKVKRFQDAKEVIDKIENDYGRTMENVVVVGAGYIGVELAEAFKRLGYHTTMITQPDRVLNTYYDKPFTDVMEDNLRSHRVDVRLSENVLAFEGKNKVSKVVTDKGSYPCDMALICCGFLPNTDLVQGHLDLGVKGAILTDKHQATSDPNVYAIGDCTTIFSNVIDDLDYIALASNAVRSGIVAGHNVCGNPIEANGVQGSNGIKIFDLSMVSTGITVERAQALGMDVLYTDFKALQKPEFIKEDNYEVTIRIVYDKNTRQIKGAQLMSKYDMSMMIHMFSLAIQEKVTIDRLSLTDFFFLPHYNQPYNYITMAALSAE